MFPCMSSDPPITIPGHVCFVHPFYPFGDPNLSAMPTPTLSDIWQRCKCACFVMLFLFLHCKRVLFHCLVVCEVCMLTHKQTATRSYRTLYFAVELGMAGGCDNHSAFKTWPTSSCWPHCVLASLCLYMHVDPCLGLLR